MKTIVKVFILIIFCLILGLGEYLQVMNYSTLSRQVNVISQNQQLILQELRIIKVQQFSLLNAQQNKLAAREHPPAEAIDFNKEYKIDIANSSFRGKKDAPVTIVEFSDFQCPYSQMFHPVAVQAFNAYPDKVKLVLKNFPLGYHPLARPAVKATFAAREQGKYWEMVDAIFKEGKNLSQEKFQEIAQKIGLNMKKFQQDLKEKDAQWEKFIEEDIDSANKAEVRGTPTFFLNGKFFQGRSFEEFKAAIERILKEKP